jgi:hypothetical protein
MRYIALSAGLAVAAMLTLAPPAFAQISNPRHPANSGTCPQGSCSKGGGSYANNVANCSPKNCKH